MSELISLAVIENKTALDIFSIDESEKIICAIECQARSIVPDVSTAPGRKAIASLAHQVSKSKTLLDTYGKDLVSDWKTKAKAVDLERKKFRDRLDALRDEVRAPLAEWETTEKARLEAETLALQVAAAHEFAVIEHELWLVKKDNERLEFEKFQREAEHKEHQRLFDEVEKDAERQRNLIADATAKAEREKQEALELAELKRLADIKVAEGKAKAEAERVESDRLQREAEEKREIELASADSARRAQVNTIIIDNLLGCGINIYNAESLLEKIAAGEIPHLSINYYE